MPFIRRRDVELIRDVGDIEASNTKRAKVRTPVSPMKTPTFADDPHFTVCLHPSSGSRFGYRTC